MGYILGDHKQQGAIETSARAITSDSNPRSYFEVAHDIMVVSQK